MGIIREEADRPGWYFLVKWTPKDGKPRGLHALSIVHVIYHDGSEDVSIRADKVAWSRVDRFMVINHFSIARPHAGIADPCEVPKSAPEQPVIFFNDKQRALGNKPVDIAPHVVVSALYVNGNTHVANADDIRWGEVRSYVLANGSEWWAQKFGETDGTEAAVRAEPVVPQATPENAKKYNHYFVRVPFTHIDVYRLLELFKVTDNAIGHAIKKLLVPGLRGGKPTKQDIIEARDTLNRRIEMWDEDEATKDDML